MTSRATRDIVKRGTAADRHKGTALIYLAIVMTATIGFCSIGVDYGRVQVVKTELRRTADAAARYAVTGLAQSGSTARTYAQDAAAENTADGSSVSIDVTQDVEFGLWDTTARTFTSVSSNRANAVRVWCRRTSARGNAIPLLFAKAIGMNTCDVNASATASIVGIKFAVVGLDYIKMSGNSSTAYWSKTGSSAGNFGNIGSNGDITLGGSTQINGNAFPGVGKLVYGSSAVTGSTTPLVTPLSYPVEDPSPYNSSNNDNGLCPSGTVSASSFSLGGNKSATLPAGHYYFNNVTISGTLTFTGPATIYCYGNFSMNGNATTFNSIPGNLRVVMVKTPSGNSPGGLSVTSSSALYADVYAPLSAITLGGTGDIYGSVVGKSIDMTGTSAIHYDLSLNPNGGHISLVQ